MGQGALNYQGVKGGLKLNDVIEEFKYVYKDKTIKAGDFVNYINGVAGQTTETSVDTQLSAAAMSGYKMSAVVLDDNRVFIAHSHTNNYYLYGIVIKIDGATITVGTDTQLSSEGMGGYIPSVALLNNGNVFITTRTDSTNTYLYGVVCKISGMTITKGSITKISSVGYSYEIAEAITLSNGNVFIAYNYGNNSYLYGMICTISGTTITSGTETQISTERKTSYGISPNLLPNGNVFIAHSYSSSYYLYGIVCTISGTTITAGTDTALVNSVSGKYISSVVLNNDNIFIAHRYDYSSEDFYLYGMICTISGTTITAGTDKALSLTKKAGEVFKAFGLKNGNIFIADTQDATYTLRGLICTISGTSITNTKPYILNTNTGTGKVIESLLLPNGNVLVAHSSDNTNYYLNAQIFGIDEANNIPTNEIVITDYEQQVTLSTEPPFDGIALSNGVGGDDTAHNEQVKIARPLYIDNLVRNGDFSNSLEGWTDLNLNTSYPISWSINNDGLKFITNSNWTGIKTGKEQIIKSQIPAGHLFYASMSIKGSFSSAHSVVLAVSNGDYASSINVTNVSSTPSKVSLRYNSTYLYDRVQIWVRSVKSGDTATITDIKCYDLTAIFGKDNEPTKEWCDNNL